MSKAVNISQTTNVNSGDQVIPEAATTTPSALGTAAIGTAITFARADHVHEAPIGGTSNTLITGTSGAAAIDTVLSETLQILSADNIDVPTTTLVTQLTATGLTAGWWLAEYYIHWGSSATTTGITFTVSHSGTTQTFMATRTDPNSGTALATVGISSQAAGAGGVTGQLPSVFTTNVNSGALGPNAGVTTANSIQYSTITALFLSSTLGDLRLQVKSEVAASAVRVKAGTNARYTYLSPMSGRAIFGYGYSGGGLASITNLVSNIGVVATDTTGVGTARYYLAAAGYGNDKAIFGYGITAANLSMTNLVSNTGVVSTDTTGVGTDRRGLAAAGYGTDKAIFGYGNSTTFVSMTNLVSNTGVVSTDTTGVGTARWALAAAGYGTDKAIFGYGNSTVVVSLTNLVSNIGVVATDTTGVGTARDLLAAAGYGTDKAIFGYGYTITYVSLTNLVSNTGVVATDTTGVGTSRYYLAAAGYGTGKAIFGYGNSTTFVSITNLVSNTGVVSTDTTGVGTARWALAAASFS